MVKIKKVSDEELKKKIKSGYNLILLYGILFICMLLISGVTNLTITWIGSFLFLIMFTTTIIIRNQLMIRLEIREQTKVIQHDREQR